jgi:hypothetical protein
VCSHAGRCLPPPLGGHALGRHDPIGEEEDMYIGIGTLVLIILLILLLT